MKTPATKLDKVFNGLVDDGLSWKKTVFTRPLKFKFALLFWQKLCLKPKL